MAYDDSTGIFSTPVNFHITDNDEAILALLRKAAEVDDENLGKHQVAYSVEQAFTVVWHTEPEWLVTSGVLIGWTVEKRGLFNKENIDWIEAPE